MTLAAQGLESGYSRERPVLRGVDLSLVEGEFLALLGPNGCGKSTLLRTLVGILDPSGGTILLDQGPLQDLPSKEKPRHIGYLPQEIHPALPYRVEEAVALGARCVGGRGRATQLPAAAIQRALEQADAVSLSGRLLEELSGGERRRVYLAGVLAQQPRFLLLDEPAAMLDLAHQSATFRALRGLADEGMGVLCVTHDPNLASVYADTMAILDAGKIRAIGTPDEVLSSGIFQTLYGDSVEILTLGDRGFAVLPR